jgi:hypothetical protein
MVVDFTLFGVMIGQLIVWSHAFAKERRFVRVIVVRSLGTG